ncbi:MAG: alpha/beta hydrolase family protein [Vulcanimicrobiaceae bacterium]
MGDIGAYRYRGMLAFALAVLGGFWPLIAAAVPADCRAALGSAGQNYRVGTVYYGLRDTRSGSVLALRILYPMGEGPFPVVVFSPGLGAGPYDYAEINHYWAQHGYVTVTIGHLDYALRRRMERLGVSEFSYEARMHLELHSPAFWAKRAGELDDVIDALSFIEDSSPVFHEAFDLTRIGVAGHSMGADTASLVAGATLAGRGWNAENDFARPNVSAFLLMSPDGPGSLGFNEQSWTHVTKPLMVLVGALDLGPDRQSAKWRLGAFEQVHGPNAYGLEIDDADHQTLTGSETGDATSSAAFADAESASLAFWDAYLKGDAAAKAQLTAAAFSDCSGGLMHLERKGNRRNSRREYPRDGA